MHPDLFCRGNQSTLSVLDKMAPAPRVYFSSILPTPFVHAEFEQTDQQIHLALQLTRWIPVVLASADIQFDLWV